MFLIDDLLLAPGKAALFIFQELARKAQEEFLDDDSVKRELQEIYNLLSSGKISEAEFDGRENVLLERLAQIAKLKFPGIAGADETVDTEALQESAAEPVTVLAPDQPIGIHAAPPVAAIESQFKIAPLRAPDSPDVDLSAGVLQAVRAFSHLLSPVTTTDEPANKGPKKPELWLSELDTVTNHVQPPCEPLPAAVVKAASASPPPLQPQPAPAAPTPAPSVLPPAPKPFGMSDAVDTALRTLAITRLKVSSVISAGKADDGWRVGVELVERAAVPDSGDLLGVYEVELNHAGDVTRYERTRVRRRNDLK
jgi:hypothetical protein